ncbi:MAG: inositol monophosphatase [Bacteroidales bacterium]|nr:inositol monophosphatase [Bacteroidales bacterium]
MNKSSLISDISNAAIDAGKFLIESAKSFDIEKVETKGENNFVSYVDKESEKILIDKLSKIIPKSGFIAEESGSKEIKNEWVWVIDPLDGTTNFIHGIPLYSVSIGLLKDGELFAGVIYEPNINELFHAIKGEGAFLNGKRIFVTKTSELKDSFWATGFPYSDFDMMDKYINFIKFSIENTHGIRRLGSAAVDLAYTACGRLDGFFEFGLSPWDVAAGALIVKEANGKVADFKKGNDYIYGKEIIACNHALFESFYAEFNRIYFSK